MSMISPGDDSGEDARNYVPLDGTPASQDGYQPPRKRMWLSVLVGSLLAAAALGAAVGIVLGYHALRAAVLHTRHIKVHSLSAPPAACTDWETRCRAGAAAAAAQGHGAFWPAAMCCEAAVSSPPGAAPASGKLSCANRASVWASPSLGLHPHPLKAHGTAVRDVLGADTLMLFLPGTGTEPDQARALLEAASDMGYHVLGLSYAALPIAVSQMDLWCTRPGADAAACNAQLHEAVLYGKPTGDAAGGLWSVEKAESVEALAVAALHQLKWSQFVGGDNASVAWDRVVVSGHSQGASHAAYLSTTRKTRAAVLLSGPQECPDCAKGWLRGGPPTLRRAAYSLREECGDTPYNRESYCAKLHPGLQKRNLEAMGLAPGLLGNESGYVVVDFAPLELGKGRPHHDSVALGAQAPAGVVALWKTLFAAL